MSFEEKLIVIGVILLVSFMGLLTSASEGVKVIFGILFLGSLVGVFEMLYIAIRETIKE